MTSWDTGAGLEMDIPFRELGRRQPLLILSGCKAVFYCSLL